MDWAAVRLSLQLALCTTSILFVVGLPVAYWLATTKWRGRFLLEALIALPLVLPPTVLGFYLLISLGPLSPLGRLFREIFGHNLPFTFQGILIGSLIYNVPFALRPFVSAFAAVDRRLVEASWSLGISGFQTFLRTTLPLSWPGILSGLVLCFSHTVGEFGVVLMLGGNIPEVTRTLSISIYDDVQSLHYAAAAQTSTVLLLFAFFTLCAMYGLQKRPLPV